MLMLRDARPKGNARVFQRSPEVFRHAWPWCLSSAEPGGIGGLAVGQATEYKKEGAWTAFPPLPLSSRPRRP